MEKLVKLRKVLSEKSCYGMIIPSNDPHFSEYVAPHWKCRSYISGFTGSAGTVVVTLDKAAIWVDSRYFIQVEKECDTNIFSVQRIGIGTISINQWLAQNSPKGSVIAVEGGIFSTKDFEESCNELQKDDISLMAFDSIFDEVWQERPPRPISMVHIMSAEISGETTSSKLERLRIEANIGDSKHYIVTALDEIAWLLNIRGADVNFNPVIVSYAIVTNSDVKLFIDDNKILEEDLQYFKENGIDILNYDKFAEYLSTIKNQTVKFNPAKLGVAYSNIIKNGGNSIEREEGASLVAIFKSVKNRVEIEGFEKAMVEDGVALCKFHYWLENEVKSGAQYTERELGPKLASFRAQSKLYISESFNPIIAMGENSALPHYTAKPSGSPIVTNQNFLLMDTGGQYQCGTTDMTRTIHYGELSEQQKLDYTLVLQGMIDLTTVVFPINTRGSQLDIMARHNLFSEGLNYGHGTGHGIGHYLNVHEGPQSIRAEKNPEVIKAGMVMSNEPGIYRHGEYGVRTENVMVCEEFAKNQFGEFLKFRTITLFPIATRPIIIERLSVAQRQWLNRYHSKVYDTLSVHLSSEEQLWLAQKTKAI